MSILIIILSVIVGIIVFFLVVASFVKKDFVLGKDIMVNKPAHEVFDYIKLIRNQEKYSVWVMKDPNIKILYAGEDGKVGFTSSWTSDDKNVGVGAQEIMDVQEGKSIKVEIRFKKPFEATNYATTSVEAISPSQTKLSNVLTGTQKFPMNVMNLFMDKLVGKDMQTNLENVKKNLEA